MSTYYYLILTITVWGGLLEAMDKQVAPSMKMTDFCTNGQHYQNIFNGIIQHDNHATKGALCSLLNIPSDSLKKFDFNNLARTDNNNVLAEKIASHQLALKFLKKTAKQVDETNAELIHTFEPYALTQRIKEAFCGAFRLFAVGILLRVAFIELMRPVGESEIPGIYRNNIFPLLSKSCTNILAWDKEVARACCILGASAFGLSQLRSGILNINKAIFFNRVCYQQKAITAANYQALKQIMNFAKKKKAALKKESKSEVD